MCVCETNIFNLSLLFTWPDNKNLHRELCHLIKSGQEHLCPLWCKIVGQRLSYVYCIVFLGKSVSKVDLFDTISHNVQNY